MNEYPGAEAFLRQIEQEATLDKALASLAEEGEINGAHQAIVAAGWQDILRGNNRSYLLSSARNREEATILAALADTLPEPMASWARYRLQSMSGIADQAKEIAAILKSGAPPQPGSLLRRIMRGDKQ